MKRVELLEQLREAQRRWAAGIQALVDDGMSDEQVRDLIHDEMLAAAGPGEARDALRA